MRQTIELAAVGGQCCPLCRTREGCDEAEAVLKKFPENFRRNFCAHLGGAAAHKFHTVCPRGPPALLGALLRGAP